VLVSSPGEGGWQWGRGSVQKGPTLSTMQAAITAPALQGFLCCMCANGSHASISGVKKQQRSSRIDDYLTAPPQVSLGAWGSMGCWSPALHAASVGRKYVFLMSSSRL
jgi:hypothetical protein